MEIMLTRFSLILQTFIARGDEKFPRKQTTCLCSLAERFQDEAPPSTSVGRRISYDTSGAHVEIEGMGSWGLSHAYLGQRCMIFFFRLQCTCIFLSIY